MDLPSHNRYDYSPIDKRPTYDWPNGARLAVTICNNVEIFAYRSGFGSDHSAGHAPQNQRNFGWRDYGNRVGIWALFDLLDTYGVRASHNVNSAALEAYPDITERILARGDEIIAHGRTNAERQDGLWQSDERALIEQCTAVIERLGGKRPRGWMGPYMAQSGYTLDLLQELGYEYVLDWPADDQPFWLKTRAGRIMSVPYPLEINDLPAQIFRQHSAREFTDMIIDQFDEMLMRSQKYPLVFGISVHPFIVGQPFRMRAFRQAMDHVMAHSDQCWIATPGDICRYITTEARI